jgi:hypothetical protein
MLPEVLVFTPYHSEMLHEELRESSFPHILYIYLKYKNRNLCREEQQQGLPTYLMQIVQAFLCFFYS